MCCGLYLEASFQDKWLHNQLYSLEQSLISEHNRPDQGEDSKKEICHKSKENERDRKWLVKGQWVTLRDHVFFAAVYIHRRLKGCGTTPCTNAPQRRCVAIVGWGERQTRWGRGMGVVGCQVITAITRQGSVTVSHICPPTPISAVTGEGVTQTCPFLPTAVITESARCNRYEAALACWVAKQKAPVIISC